LLLAKLPRGLAIHHSLIRRPHLHVAFILIRWDKRNTIPVSKIEPKQGEVTCLEPLRDNCFLSGGKDGTVKLHDVRIGVNKFYTFKDHTAAVTSIRRLEGKEGKESDIPHQVLFASGAINGEVLLWGE
jgi:WD40 repeat protein